MRKRSEKEKEWERARRLRELSERAFKRNQEARQKAEELQRRLPKKQKPEEKAEGA